MLDNSEFSRFGNFIYYIEEVSLSLRRLCNKVMKEYGLKGPYMVYFTSLAKSEDGMSSQELAEVCCKDKADVSRDVKALEQAGYLCRRADNPSRYRSHVLLTEQGKEIAEKLFNMAGNMVMRVGGELKDLERESFWYSLELIASNLRKLSDAGYPYGYENDFTSAEEAEKDAENKIATLTGESAQEQEPEPSEEKAEAETETADADY